MTPQEAAVESAAAISGLTARFMLDPATYQYGATLGFQGMAFYFGGRGGVLGDVDADSVTDALVFFQPDNVRSNWESAAAVMPRDKAALEFQNICSRWAEEHLPDEFDAATLAALAERVAAAADATGAPVFEGWRNLQPPASPKAAAAHHMNSLRELRFTLHARAVLAQGIAPQDAVMHRQPYMYALFGWGEPSEATPELVADWNKAEEETNAAMAKAFGALSSEELGTFVALANEALAASA